MKPTTSTSAGTHRRKVTAAGLLIVGAVLMLMSVVFADLAGADPKGNNGAIKIDGVALQGGQANEPHVDCEFALEFSGYDKGDLQATVRFELQAPTRRASGSQVLLTDTLNIGEDPAGGATDLDASKLYRLDFTGVTPHAQQGYHVKVTVHADGSQGADTKHKVFWVQACAAPTTTTTTTTSTTTATPTTTTTPTTVATTGATTPTTAAVLGETKATTPTQVLGERVERPETALPRTGRSVGRLAFLGGLAVALGGLISLLNVWVGSRCFRALPGTGRRGA